MKEAEKYSQKLVADVAQAFGVSEDYLIQTLDLILEDREADTEYMWDGSGD